MDKDLTIQRHLDLFEESAYYGKERLNRLIFLENWFDKIKQKLNDEIVLFLVEKLTLLQWEQCFPIVSHFEREFVTNKEYDWQTFQLKFSLPIYTYFNKQFVLEAETLTKNIMNTLPNGTIIVHKTVRKIVYNNVLLPYSEKNRFEH